MHSIGVEHFTLIVRHKVNRHFTLILRHKVNRHFTLIVIYSEKLSFYLF